MAGAGRNRLFRLPCSTTEFSGSTRSASGDACVGGAARRTASRGNGSRSWPPTFFPSPAFSTPGPATASPSNIRGGSRMRESRTYGCVRGRSVMDVPTAIHSPACFAYDRGLCYAATWGPGTTAVFVPDAIVAYPMPCPGAVAAVPPIGARAEGAPYARDHRGSVANLALDVTHGQARRDVAAEGKQERYRRQHIDDRGGHHRVIRRVDVLEQLALRHRNGHVSYRKQHGLVQIVVPGEQQRVDGDDRKRRRHQGQIDAQIQLNGGCAVDARCIVQFKRYQAPI